MALSREPHATPPIGYRRVFHVDHGRYGQRGWGRNRPKNTVEEWTMVDDLPASIPVTKAEVEIFEAYFGDLFDQFFGRRS